MLDELALQRILNMLKIDVGVARQQIDLVAHQEDGSLCAQYVLHARPNGAGKIEKVHQNNSQCKFVLNAGYGVHIGRWGHHHIQCDVVVVQKVTTLAGDRLQFLLRPIPEYFTWYIAWQGGIRAMKVCAAAVAWNL